MSIPKLHIGRKLWPGLLMVVAAVTGILYGMSTSRAPPPILAGPTIEDIKLIVETAVAPVREDVKGLVSLGQKIGSRLAEPKPKLEMWPDEPQSPPKKKKRRGAGKNTGQTCGDDPANENGVSKTLMSLLAAMHQTLGSSAPARGVHARPCWTGDLDRRRMEDLKRNSSPLRVGPRSLWS
jgi:hypothetical protein